MVAMDEFGASIWVLTRQSDIITSADIDRTPPPSASLSSISPISWPVPQDKAQSKTVLGYMSFCIPVIQKNDQLKLYVTPCLCNSHQQCSHLDSQRLDVGTCWARRASQDVSVCQSSPRSALAENACQILYLKPCVPVKDCKGGELTDFPTQDTNTQHI